MTKPNVIHIVFIDEMDLNNLNHVQSLRFINGLLDLGIEVDDVKNRRYIPTIEVSNYELDFVNMSRTIAVYTELLSKRKLVYLFSYMNFLHETTPWEQHYSDRQF
jgi:hypothetical protein